MCVSCFASATGFDPDPIPFPEEAGPLAWPDGAPAGGTLRWTGVAGFRFELDGTSIAFDPFVSRPGALRVLLRRPRIETREVAARYAGLDAVFVGHSHYDHAMDLPAVARVSPRAPIHGSLTTVELLRRLDAASGRRVPVRDSDRIEVGPFTVTVVASAHGTVPIVGRFDHVGLRGSGLPRTPFRYPRGAVFAWRVEAGGRTFHVQGSAGIDEPALARQPPVDALIACLAARKGTPDYLPRLGRALRPRLLIPCHHDDFFRPLSAAPRPVPRLDWPAFVRDARALETAWGTRLHCPPLDRTVAW